MNNLSALDTRVSADELELNFQIHIQTAIYFEYYMLQIRMFYFNIEMN